MTTNIIIPISAIDGGGNYDPDLLLFDMEEDPDESNNLATLEQYRSILDDHEAMLADWDEKLAWSPSVSKEKYESRFPYSAKYWV